MTYGSYKKILKAVGIGIDDQNKNKSALILGCGFCQEALLLRQLLLSVHVVDVPGTLNAATSSLTNNSNFLHLHR
jgi:hypothetical protein